MKDYESDGLTCTTKCRRDDELGFPFPNKDLLGGETNRVLTTKLVFADT